MTHRIIFDCDPGIDDAMAILFAQASKDIELLGITTTFGNAYIEQTTRNAQYMKQRFDLTCPVLKGAGEPLVVPLDEPPTFVHGHDGLGDAGFEIPDMSPTPDAVDFIIEQVRSQPGEIDLVAVGRMTNLALALERAPDIASQVRSVVIMGGAFGGYGFGGNVTETAEANIYGDPHAADRVVQADWPLTVVGLDVTMRTIFTPQMREHLKQQAGDMGLFIDAMSDCYQDHYLRRTGNAGFPVHDASALACLVQPQLFDTQSGTLRVSTQENNLGQTLLDGSASGNKAACAEVDAEAVLSLYVDTLTGA